MQSRAMDPDSVWRLIEVSGAETTTRDDRTEYLIAQLAALTPEEIADFQVSLDLIRKPADTYRLWGAATVIFQGCGGDGFWYFLPWLIGLGRDVFETAVADPDSLAEVPEIRALAGRSGTWSDEEWPQWEALNYVARTAYDRRTDEEDGLLDALEACGHESPEDPAPDDEPPTDDHAAYPQLLALFPQHQSQPTDAGGIPTDILRDYLNETGQPARRTEPDLA